MLVDRKSTRLNSSHTEIYTLSLHDALPICRSRISPNSLTSIGLLLTLGVTVTLATGHQQQAYACRSEEHTSELQSHRDLHSFPTRRSSDLPIANLAKQPNKHRLVADARCDRYAGNWASATSLCL